MLRRRRGLTSLGRVTTRAREYAATALRREQISDHLVRLVLGDVAGVGHLVGYDSPTQFNREYRRLFGAPPGQDAARLRAAAPGPTSPILPAPGAAVAGSMAVPNWRP